MKRWVFILFLSCGTSVPELPFYSTADFTPKWQSPEENNHQILPFSFTNQYGETISEETFKNSVYVANFIFTSCPGICPKMSTNMQKIQEAFQYDSQVKLISHSVMPENDTVEVLRIYAESKQAIKDKWHIVTGNKHEIYTLARKAYFADENLGYGKSENDFLHTENVLLIDKKRRIRGVYNGTLPAEMHRLIEDIILLKKEG